MWKKTEKWIHKHETILLILAVTVLLRVPSLFEPYWYGDEGIYLTIGQALRRGAELYKDIHDNKPPFLYLAAALAGTQFWLRLLTMGWNLATVFIFWKLAVKWWNGERTAGWATVIFALLTSLPLIEGNIANAELYFLLPTMGAFGLLYAEKGMKQILMAGGLYGLAGLFKIPAILEAGIWPAFWLITLEKGWWKKAAVLGIGTALPIAISLGYFAWRGTLPAYLVAAGIQNVPYLASWKAVEGPIGTLAGRAAVLGVWVLILGIVRRRISRNGLLLGVWWGVTLFAALLSGRPYPHYLLQMAGALAMGAAMLGWGKAGEKKLAIGLIAVLAAAILTFKFYFYPVGGYWQNFFRWIWGKQSREEYFGWFNPMVKRNYALAKAIKAGSTKEAGIFVWGDEPMIYALAKRQPVGRYTAKYHIKDFRAEEETMRKLAEQPPKYIVVMSEKRELPGLAGWLEERYWLTEKIEGAELYRLTGGNDEKNSN